MNPRDPISLVSERTRDGPIPKVSSWFISDFNTGQILSDAIDCGDTNGCLADGCSPSFSPTASPSSSLPTSGPTMEPIINRCVTVTIACDTS